MSTKPEIEENIYLFYVGLDREKKMLKEINIADRKD